MSYTPKPIDTSRVELSEDVLELLELLAKNAHDLWALQRIKEGWKYGPKRDDTKKESPDLIPYEDLPESEKEYDRNIACSTIKGLIALGYRINKSEA